MNTKNDYSFSPIDVRLPRAVIEQAIDGELPPDFLKNLTVSVPLLPEIELGEELWVILELTGKGLISMRPRTVDQEMLDKRMGTFQLSWGLIYVGEVLLQYSLTRLNGEKINARRRVYSALMP